MAQRASISTTWYTWLEQGRGGAPSPRVLDSLAKALLLTEAEREHLFLIGIGRLPKPAAPTIDGISERLQRFLDAMPLTPAIVVTSAWDVIAWNRAAQLALTDYQSLPFGERNILKRMFLDDATRSAQQDWESVARFVVATFRAHTTKVVQDERAEELIACLVNQSDEFAQMWAQHDVQTPGEGTKGVHHPTQGEMNFEFSSFAVDGRPDLQVLVYIPSDSADKAKMQRLLDYARRRGGDADG